MIFGIDDHDHDGNGIDDHDHDGDGIDDDDDDYEYDDIDHHYLRESHQQILQK